MLFDEHLAYFETKIVSDPSGKKEDWPADRAESCRMVAEWAERVAIYYGRNVTGRQSARGLMGLPSKGYGDGVKKRGEPLVDWLTARLELVGSDAKSPGRAPT